MTSLDDLLSYQNHFFTLFEFTVVLFADVDVTSVVNAIGIFGTKQPSVHKKDPVMIYVVKRRQIIDLLLFNSPPIQ